MITSDVYRIHSHCCRVLSLLILRFDFMLVDMTTVLERFLVGEIKDTVEALYLMSLILYV